MALITLITGLLLAALGGYGYTASASIQAHAIYPLVLGVLLIVFGILARSKSEKLRMIYSHVYATLGLVGMLVAAIIALNVYGDARSAGDDPDMVLIKYLLTMAGLLLVYLNFCVQSFLKARALRKAAEERN